MQSDKKALRRVAMASVIGATIEWYDFFLYGIVAGIVFNKLYFPAGDPTINTLLAYATFAVGFAARPIGGIVFGHFGDRVGRKSMLIITLVIMGLSTFAMGVIPTFEQIGYWAPALLILCRVVQGIGLGGEWGGAILMAYEFAPTSKRGFYASLPQVGLSLGVLLSAGYLGLMSAILTDEQFMLWGWRVGFIVSCGLVFFGLWIRLKIVETPDFSKVKEKNKEAAIPFFDMIKRYPRNTLLGLGARHIDGVFFNIFSVFSINYLTQTLHFPRDTSLIGVMIGAVTLTVFIPVFGHLSDKLGRIRLYGWASLITAASCFPAFWLMQSANGNIYLVWLAIAVPFGVIYAAVYGTVSSFLCDLYDARVRYTGISFVYQFSSVTAGGLTPIIATMLLATGNGDPIYICAYVLASGILSALCTYLIGRGDKATPSPEAFSSEPGQYRIPQADSTRITNPTL
ncbi:major facilitator transporter [Advenella kashmirensis W13003]|uniref:Major facilitator transporter n=1 Tax=Advenella kashmirensis W13003 TaxID=1424334 RepID=V8QQN1_9BURK|nr:MFS transporter [Advenella kashmirensis]ETF01605.1 major facilitator transporter [Advenella kashmirensis W13003]